MRSALRRLADICHLLKPPRAKKYTGPILAILADFLRLDDETLMETIAGCAPKLFRTFAFFFNAEQVVAVDKLFLPFLLHAQAPMRRSAALCVTALCAASPIPRHSTLVDTILEEKARIGDSAPFRHGLLMCMLNLVRDRRSIPDDEDPLKAISTRILSICCERFALFLSHHSPRCSSRTTTTTKQCEAR